VIRLSKSTEVECHSKVPVQSRNQEPAGKVQFGGQWRYQSIIGDTNVVGCISCGEKDFQGGEGRRKGPLANQSTRHAKDKENYPTLPWTFGSADAAIHCGQCWRGRKRPVWGERVIKVIRGGKVL
jgi:hypothetical protein